MFAPVIIRPNKVSLCAMGGHCCNNLFSDIELVAEKLNGWMGRLLFKQTCTIQLHSKALQCTAKILALRRVALLLLQWPALERWKNAF